MDFQRSLGTEIDLGIVEPGDSWADPFCLQLLGAVPVATTGRFEFLSIVEGHDESVAPDANVAVESLEDYLCEVPGIPGTLGLSKRGAPLVLGDNVGIDFSAAEPYKTPGSLKDAHGGAVWTGSAQGIPFCSSAGLWHGFTTEAQSTQRSLPGRHGYRSSPYDSRGWTGGGRAPEDRR